MARRKKPKDKVPTKQLYFNQVVGDSSQWPKESIVDEDATIRKQDGCNKYALDSEEIQDLEFEEEK